MPFLEHLGAQQTLDGHSQSAANLYAASGEPPTHDALIGSKEDNDGL